MKIVETPPKTGEEFIVAWFDDGEAKVWRCKYNEEIEMFTRDTKMVGYVQITDKIMDMYCKNALIIIEG